MPAEASAAQPQSPTEVGGAGAAAPGPRYAILVAGEPDQAVCDSKGTFEHMFLDLLHEEGGGEEWRSYRAFKGELPTPEQLASCRGVVITGSIADAFGSEAWLVGLRATVQAAMEQRKRVLGVCFGHQLVGCVLGAKVGRAGCWEVGARRVAVDAGARRQLAGAGATWAQLLPDSLCLHEFHQDQVLEVPAGATLLASSERCPVEMFAVGPHVLCIQGHPEFDADVVRQLAAPRLGGAIGAADAARMEESLATLPVAQHAQKLRQLCRAFLKG